MKCYICINEGKESALQLGNELDVYISKTSKIQRVKNICDAEFAIVIGGDGTLLRFSQNILENSIPILAVNMGSLGFLTEIRSQDIYLVLEEFLDGKVNIVERKFIEVIFKGVKYYALNEVATTKCEAENLTAQEIKVNDVYLNTYLADGVIVATPTGSTGYSLSAGGPIMNLDVEALIINPLAPHTLSARPIIVGEKSLITIKNLKSSALKVVCDGVHIGVLQEEECLMVALSEKKIQMILPKNADYFSVLREKLGWGDSYVKRAQYQ
ncbi:MAG: NAD(+)/NADH kinase [Fusobacteria bacterium]|nr:NAD(+)/NADH kinase [Fusobacteriota bacterium]